MVQPKKCPECYENLTAPTCQVCGWTPEIIRLANLVVRRSERSAA